MCPTVRVACFSPRKITKCLRTKFPVYSFNLVGLALLSTNATTYSGREEFEPSSDILFLKNPYKYQIFL